MAMARRWFLLLALAVSVPAATARADAVIGGPVPEPTTPWYLPRAVMLGTLYFNGALTPQLRVQWEPTLIQERRDAFVFIFEAGGGYAALKPTVSLVNQTQAQMTFFYQHMLMVGLAYRGEWSNGLHVGAQGTTGPLFYGARFDNQPTEGRITGIVEGRVQIGYRLGPVVLGFSGGVASPYDKPLRVISADYLGGFSGGIFLDWRVAPSFH